MSDEENKIDEVEETIAFLDQAEVIKNISKYSSVKLSDMIVTHRYFGLYKDVSVEAMKELSVRRINGDAFDYESYIETSLNSLPKIEFKIPDMLSAIKMYIKK